MDEDFRAIGNACLLEQIKRGAGAVHTLGATRNHGTHLGITGFVDEHVHHIADTLVDHDDDVAHAIVAFERLDAPADDWLIPTETNCLGLFSSNRVPKPAANTTATTGIFCSCICSLSLIRPTVNPESVCSAFCLTFCTQSAIARRSPTIRARSAQAYDLRALCLRWWHGDARTRADFPACTGYGGFS